MSIQRIGTVYEDVTTEVLGSIGVWQWLVVMVTSAMTLLSLFSGYEDMFLLQPSKEVTCIPPERFEAVNASLCTVTSIVNATRHLKCGKWQVRLFWMISLKKSWLVFCDSNIKLLSTTMISRMGFMFGCVMSGVIADSFGRKIAITVNLYAQLVLGAVVMFCNSQAWFQLLIFLMCLFRGATLFVGPLVACEISSNEWRTKLSMIVAIPQIMAIIFMVPFANMMPNLESLSFMSSFLNIFLIVIIRWLPESPQWLLFNRRIYDAEKILFNAAKKNGIVLCSQFKIRPLNYRAYHCLDESRTCAEIITTYNISVLTLVNLLMWCLFAFRWSYLYAKVYSNNSNQSLSTIVCFVILFFILTVLLSKKFMLRQLMLINFTLSAIFAASEIVISHKTTPFFFSSLALASGLIAYAILLNITPRLFAIRIRGTLLGSCHAIGHLGTIIGYLLFVFKPLNNIVYVASDIGITLLLVALCLILVNVDGRELPDMMEDMDYFAELSKPLRWASQKTNSPSNEEVEIKIYSFGSSSYEDSPSSRGKLPARRIGAIRFWRSLSERLRKITPRS